MTEQEFRDNSDNGESFVKEVYPKETRKGILIHESNDETSNIYCPECTCRMNKILHGTEVWVKCKNQKCKYEYTLQFVLGFWKGTKFGNKDLIKERWDIDAETDKKKKDRC